MNLDVMAGILAERIPTPVEFLDFAKSQGWRISRREDGVPVLKANASDPVAVKLAKMLSREPWRSQVLALADDPANAVPAELVVPPRVEEPDPFHEAPVNLGPTNSVPAEFVECLNCKHLVCPSQLKAMTPGMWIHSCGMTETTDKNRKPSSQRCPYRPSSS